MTNQEPKPVVFYEPIDGLTQHVGVTTMVVVASGHPYIADGDLARTSTILDVRDNGEFETRNTIYKPKVAA